MSADTTNVNVDSSTESQDVKPNVPQQGGAGPMRGSWRGGRGGKSNRRPNSNPYPRNQPDEKKRFKGNENNRGGGGGGFNNQGGPNEVNFMKIQDRFINEKLKELAGPSHDLPTVDNISKKFTSRSRLYIGNLPPDTPDEEISKLFEPYGEVNELFVNKEKHFAFIRLDYHFNAEKAKNELNGTMFKGKVLKVRFSPNGSTVKVKNLDEYVTNELLHAAFSVFGEIERCVVIVDDRGKSLGEGLVEFQRKNSALSAIRKCSENCYFLTSTLRPALVEMYEANDEIDGNSEKMVRKNHEYYSRRSVGPRFAVTDSIEHEYGMRWKNLYELHNQKMDSLKKELLIEQDKLVAQMELARFEHETAMLREQLRAREMDMDRQKKEWEAREQQAEEARRANEQEMRKHEQDMQQRMMQQDEEMRRRQEENKLFMQAQQLDNMLNHQEQAFEQGDTRFEPRNEFDGPPVGGGAGFRGGNNPRFEDPPPPNMRGGFHGYRGAGGGNRWGDNHQHNRDFNNRRRF